MNNVATLPCERTNEVYLPMNKKGWQWQATSRGRSLAYAFCKWTAIGIANPEHNKCFSSYHLQNQANSDKILYLLSWIYLPQSIINVFHLIYIMRLHYLMKLKIRVFVKILLEKQNSKNVTYWLWFYLLKKCNFLTLTSRYGKFNQETMYQTSSESTSFCKRYDKNILVCFSVHSSSCCSLAKRECLISQGRAETLLRWGGKRLHFCTTYLLRTTCTKFYHSGFGFVDCISTNILVCFFGSLYSIACLQYTTINVVSPLFSILAPKLRINMFKNTWVDYSISARLKYKTRT